MPYDSGPKSRLRTVRFVTGHAEAGERLDKILAARVPDLSRRKLRVLLDIGGVFVDRRRVKVASRQLRAGQTVEIHIGGALLRAGSGVGSHARQQDAASLPAFQIVFEDADIVVVDKPAGLLSAPTPESDRQNLFDLLRRRPPPLGGFVSLVHRIDLHTSGLLVFAKTEDAGRALSERFRVHDIERGYLAVVSGTLAEESVSVRAKVKGKDAVTHLAVRENIGNLATVLGARLETGRTHQIRIHCRHIGHPVLGDPAYGERSDLMPPRLSLHAESLGFAHPRTGERLAFTSPLPDDLTTWLAEIRALANAPLPDQEHGQGQEQGVPHD